MTACHYNDEFKISWQYPAMVLNLLISHRREGELFYLHFAKQVSSVVIVRYFIHEDFACSTSGGFFCFFFFTFSFQNANRMPQILPGRFPIFRWFLGDS